jgi:hypothetical protein
MLGFVVVLAACSGSGQSTGATTPAPVANKAPPPSGPLEAELTPAPDEPIAMMRQFSDQMCACHDKPCADEVTDRMMAWGQEMSKTHAKAEPVGKDEATQIAKLSERFSNCLSVIATAAMNAQGSAATP